VGSEEVECEADVSRGDVIEWCGAIQCPERCLRRRQVRRLKGVRQIAADDPPDAKIE
jgi:hypothetical protein